jgi:hypothetical protein
MFEDQDLSDQKTRMVAKRTTDNPVTELIYWARVNLDDAGTSDFTQGHFSCVEDFRSALKQTVQDLGILDDKGLVSNFSFFISGEKKREIYLAGVMALTVDQQAMIAERFKVSIVDVDKNLYRLDWQ